MLGIGADDEAFAVFLDEDGLVFQEGSGAAGFVGGLGEGGAEFDRVVVAEDEEGAQGRGEGFEEFGDVGEGGFPEPRAVAEVAGDQEEVGLERGEGFAPGIEAFVPVGDVHVGEVEDNQAVEGLGEAGAGEVEEVDVGLVEHG